MNTLIDKLFTTPMSWLLAVPIVLADRLLSTDLADSPHRDAPSISGSRF
ncbi:hypothetical protein EV641_10663 [Rhodococcus sp. SMB37]|nr:hypothetical protein [Rhodococcus sp. SMB37]TCN53419.1 hypothetical protein EV641_10663 [Rhodococcus sp. SMB37]